MGGGQGVGDDGLVGVEHLVHQADLLGALGRQAAAGVGQFAQHAVADDAWQALQGADVGIAVHTPQGLVVPVLRDADHLSLAGIEKGIAALGKAARDGALTLDQLQGGTFTITNGGTYGSLMSTPILNAPQSGILGMHNIVQRPMAVDGQVVIRPMMYLALSYDHRIVDGKEAVTFLVRVKELLEDPARALLDL